MEKWRFGSEPHLEVCHRSVAVVHEVAGVGLDGRAVMPHSCIVVTLTKGFVALGLGCFGSLLDLRIRSGLRMILAASCKLRRNLSTSIQGASDALLSLF